MITTQTNISAENALYNAADKFLITCTFNVDGTITSANDIFCEITQYTRQEILSKGFQLLHHKFNQGKTYNSIIASINKSQSWRGEFKIYSKNDKPLWFDAMISLNTEDASDGHNYIMVATDVTDKVFNKQQLNKNRELSNLRFNAIHEMITLSKPDGRRTFANKNFCDFFGKNAEDLIERDYDFDDVQGIEEYLAQLRNLTPQRPNITNVHLLTNAKKEQRWIMWSETGIFDTEGNLAEILSIGKDITHLKQAQEEVINQKKFTEEILNNIPADIALFDADHRYVFVNQKGIANDSMRNWLIGKTDFDYCALKNFDTAVAQKRHANFEKAVKENMQVEWVDEHITKEGEKKYILRKFYPYKVDGTIKYVIGYAIDVTSIKNADEQKDEYIYQLEQLAFTTSHKIRQPVSNILGLLSMLENDDASSEEKLQVMQYIKQSASMLDDFTREMSGALQMFANKLVPKQ